MKADNYVHNARNAQYQDDRIIQHVATQYTDYTIPAP
jgi:hypothetical protein